MYLMLMIFGKRYELLMLSLGDDAVRARGVSIPQPMLKKIPLA